MSKTITKSQRQTWQKIKATKGEFHADDFCLKLKMRRATLAAHLKALAEAGLLTMRYEWIKSYKICVYKVNQEGS